MSIISAGTSNTTSIVYTGDTTGNLVFQSNGTTEAMRIDTNQNVGIGTATPTQKLDLTGGNAAITGTGYLSLQRPIIPVVNQGTPQIAFQYYTTGTTIVGNTVYFNRNDQLSAYTLNLSQYSADTYVTGVTFNDNQLIIARNDGVDLSTFINSF